MKPPQYVTVIGKRFVVKEHEDLNGELGRCDCDKTTILFDAEQSLEALRDTVLHEVVHAVDHSMGTKMTEAQVRRMATGLLAVLRENAPFVKFLTA